MDNTSEFLQKFNIPDDPNASYMCIACKHCTGLDCDPASGTSIMCSLDDGSVQKLHMSDTYGCDHFESE